MILAILQARTSSNRLPGKVLMPILGVPMILRQIERILDSEKIDKLVVATSTDKSDDELVDILTKANILVYRGSLDDVLDRFYKVACEYNADNIVRLTGDCPLADPDVIDNVIDIHLSKKADYTSNALNPTYPDGLDIEIFNFNALKISWNEGELPSEREHVTSYIYNNSDNFVICNVTNNKDLSGLRWTVDEKEDFEFVEKIYSELYFENKKFRFNDILALLHDVPELVKINSKFVRNEGYIKSKIADNVFVKSKN